MKKRTKKPKSKWDSDGGWNYRVIKIANTPLKGLPQTYSYGIYDVYYSKTGIPHSWGMNPQHPIGETWNELYADYNLMHDAFKKPTLELKDDKLKEIGLFK